MEHRNEKLESSEHYNIMKPNPPQKPFCCRHTSGCPFLS